MTTSPPFGCARSSWPSSPAAGQRARGGRPSARRGRGRARRRRRGRLTCARPSRASSGRRSSARASRPLPPRPTCCSSGSIPREIRMSLRAGAAPIVSRTIVDAGRSARSAALDWLARRQSGSRSGRPDRGGARPAGAGGRSTGYANQPPLRSATIPTRDATGPDAVLAADSTQRGRIHRIVDLGGHSWRRTDVSQSIQESRNRRPGVSVTHVSRSTLQHQASPDSWLSRGRRWRSGRSGCRGTTWALPRSSGRDWHGRRLLPRRRRSASASRLVRCGRVLSRTSVTSNAIGVLGHEHHHSKRVPGALRCASGHGAAFV